MEHDEQVLELQHIMGNGLLALAYLYRTCTRSGAYTRDEVMEMARRCREMERVLVEYAGAIDGVGGK
jgi:hypothetical protein